jgi:hypothetical protein
MKRQVVNHLSFPIGQKILIVAVRWNKAGLSEEFMMGNSLGSFGYKALLAQIT